MMASLMGLILAILLFWAPPAMAAVLHVSGVKLEPCPQADVGAQPEFRRPLGASCYALSGEVLNSGTKPVGAGVNDERLPLELELNLEE
ncbi:MAG: hypothetical protein EB123_02025 [Synechococcaceae bacterium WBB_32_011]|nr:hypothetical protein [Synechococcaceae bacterium WBB_32_011]